MDHKSKYWMKKRATHCYYCKCLLAGKRKTLDHRIPKSRGGPDIPENIVICCLPCNEEKGCLTDYEFKAVLVFRLLVTLKNALIGLWSAV